MGWKSFRDWIADEEKRGGVVRIKVPIKAGDPNSIVDVVPADLREENLRVNRTPGASGKQMETELKAIGRYLHSLPDKPIGILEKPVCNRPDIPIVINPWASRERALRMLGCKDKEDLCAKFARFKTSTIPPVKIEKKQAPVKEVIIPEDKIDLYRDIPRTWVEFENVPFSPTGGSQWIIYDPKSRTHELGEWRIGLFEWDEGDPNRPHPEARRKKCMYASLIFQGIVETDGGRYFRENYRKYGKPMPAAFAMANDPAILITACARHGLVWPEDGVDEFAAAGGFKGEPIEMVEAETIPGMLVPAHAEWVFEGEFLPETYLLPEYSDANFSGYMTGKKSPSVFRLKCITHRKNPWWCQTWSGNGLDHEGPHTGLLNLVNEVEAINYMRQNTYNVKDIVSYDCHTVVVQSGIDGAEKTPYYGKTLLNTLYGCPNRYIGNSNKYYIAVGPDINPYDLRDVIFAVNTRSEPVSDSIMIEKGCCPWGDPMGLPDPLGWKAYGEQMMIDALIKVPERYAEFAPRSEPVSWEKKAIKRMEERLARQK